ncbi:MAG: FAD-dependent oxidoreductase [Clostridia bacterium]
MKNVLIIGGGLAGCTAALELVSNNYKVIIAEKSDTIGGKVRNYGCKATTHCNHCGLCLIGDLWNRVEENENIEILRGCQVLDVYEDKRGFNVDIEENRNIRTLENIFNIIVSIGFDNFSSISTGSVELENGSNVVSGYQLEQMLLNRGKNQIFSSPPKSVAFLQCFGSRDIQEKAGYCSRVCCGYSTRAARVLKQYYPETEIFFFYMDLQQVEAREYFNCLTHEGITFIKSRPIKIKSKETNVILYEKPGANEFVEQEFDMIICSEGIHPSKDTAKIAEICKLGIDKDGFLKVVKNGSSTGIYLIGCASGPKKIEEVYTESLQTARAICGGII